MFPHFVLDRSKPGTVCVDQRGRRFVNESTSYHLFAKAMFDADQVAPCIPCFIVTDAVGLKKYGLGLVRMGARNIGAFLKDGYLVEGRTLEELAGKLGIDAAELGRTVAAMNDYAKTGVDPEFGRGESAYHCNNGDPNAGLPNPTLGPIKTAPFYAVRLYPGDIGAATGLVIDEWARVLDGENKPIGRLYACGNEANSVMGGTYPGPGVTLGPAIAFAYRAARHALGRPQGGSTGPGATPGGGRAVLPVGRSWDGGSRPYPRTSAPRVLPQAAGASRRNNTFSQYFGQKDVLAGVITGLNNVSGR